MGHDMYNPLIDIFNMGMDRDLREPKIMPYAGTVLNLGAGNKKIPRAIPLDLPDWDADTQPIPYEDGTVAGIWAFHFLEHCREPVAVLLECQRVLQNGGLMNIVVPHYAGGMAYQDLDHKHFFTEETWKTLFQNPYYDKNRVTWEFEVRTNVIMGLVERNLALVTQLIKVVIDGDAK